MASSGLKSLISGSFKMRGFHLRVDACRRLEALLRPVAERDSDEAVEEWVERILEAVAAKNLDSAVVDKELIEKVVQVSESDWGLFCLAFERSNGRLSPHSFRFAGVISPSYIRASNAFLLLGGVELRGEPLASDLGRLGQSVGRSDEWTRTDALVGANIDYFAFCFCPFPSFLPSFLSSTDRPKCGSGKAKANGRSYKKFAAKSSLVSSVRPFNVRYFLLASDAKAGRADDT